MDNSNKQKNKLKLAIVFILVLVLAAFLYKDNIYQSNKAKELAKESAASVETVKKKADKDGYNLPLIAIETKEDININHKIFGEMKVYDNGGNNKLTDKPKVSTNISIKQRGNTTKLLPKKQYSIDLFQDNNKDKNSEKLLGMNKSSDWVLNAPFEDSSLIRNRLAYHTASKIMEYAPQTAYCEVFVDLDHNGITKEDYRGVYLLIEKIKVDPKKVNINESDEKKDETSFLAQKNNDKPGDIVLNNYGYKSYIYDYPVVVEYPKKTITEGQKTYISREISKFEKSLYDDPTKDDFMKYIDVDSFVDYYIINEFFNNPDSGILSTYFYKDYGSKIKAGPVWDFNASLGNSNVLSPYYDYEGFFMNDRPWFDMMMQNKNFVSKVIKRYKELRKTYLSDEYLINQINEYVKELGPAIKRNNDMWPMELSNQFEMFKGYDDVFLPLGQDPKKLMEFIHKHPYYEKPTANMSDTYDEEIEDIKVFIKNRGNWIDENIDKLLDFAG